MLHVGGGGGGGCVGVLGEGIFLVPYYYPFFCNMHIFKPP